MKLTKILFLTFALGICANTFAQTTPTPAATPDTETSLNVLQTRIQSVQGVSAKSLKDSEKATVLMKEGKHEEAIAAWTNIIKTNPRLGTAFNNRGYSYMQIGKLDSAIEDFNTALKFSPSSLTYNNRGMAFSRKGDYEKAMADYSKSIQLNEACA